VDEFEIILKDLRERRAAVENAILTGSEAADYPAYRELVGRRQGLYDAEQAIEDIRASLSRQEQ
jgi:hypothetical protein